MRVTDLEDFSLRQIWRPYQSQMGFDATLLSPPMSLVETAELLSEDKSGWSEAVMSRLSAIGVEFPPYIVHPLADFVRADLRSRAIAAAEQSEAAS